jgi:cell division protein FtsN
MAAVLVGAVVTGGGLAYLYKSQAGGGDTGEPPIMTADSRPIKEKPSDPGGRDFPNGSKLIYDRLDNGGGGADEPTRVAASDAQSSAEVPGVVTTGGSGTLEERIQNALRDAKKQDDPPATAAAASSLDTPRSVPTQIFRPDGSVDRSAAQRRVAPADNDAPVANAPRGVVSTQPPQLAGAPQAAPAQPRQQVAAVAPAAPIATASAGGDSGMFVQIAARNDQAAAMAAFADLQQKYASVLGNHSPSVRKVDLGEKGVWYRLMVGPMPSKADADKLCEDLKTAGMKSCFSRKE